MPTTRRRPSSAVQSPLETYLREINETALLNAAQEQELAIAIGQGDVKARDRMVRANLHLLVKVARVLGLPRKKLSIIKKAIRIYNSTPQSDQPEAGWSLGEMVTDESTKAPEEMLLTSDNLLHVMRMLETMDVREATVLRMRFGL